MKKQPNKWLIFSGLFFQIGVIMYLSYFLGIELKAKLSIDSDIPVLISSIIGLSIIIYFIIKQSKLL